ncbi:MAG: ABC transporter substrate-binding protein [Deltaproteobacteria bacterium]|nr:ABC transporter substrate-binding protein [Deltaproteobacteria bacterium]
MSYPLALPAPRPAPRLRPGGLGLLLLLGLGLGLGCPGRPTDTTTLPLLTTDNRDAEHELASAREAADAGQDARARERYQAFLRDYPNDPLRPMAQLGLGRLELADGNVENADRLFHAVAEHADPSVAERGRFYHGIALHLEGRESEALETLRAFVGRVVDPEENALLLRTIAAASLTEGDRLGAVEALDALIGAASPTSDAEEARGRLARILREEVSPEEARTLYGRLSRRGPAWPLAAERAARDAFADGNLAAVQRIVTELREHGVALDAELSAMALRAERTGEADPHIIGVVLPLTGRGRRAGELALRGLMLAAGIPASGPASPDAPQLVVRDSVGDPAKASAAIDDLVSLHRAIAIIGPIDRAAARAAAERATVLNVPLITLSPDASLENTGPMIFRLMPDARQEVDELLAAARARGLTRLAVLTVDSPYGRAIAAAAAQSDLRPIVSSVYAEDRHDLREAIDRLTGEAPDAVLLGDSSRNMQIVVPALAARGLYSAAPGAPVPRGAQRVRYLLPSSAHSPALLRAAARYLGGALLSTPFDPDAAGAQGDLGQAYRARYGEPPQLFAATAYDAFALIRAAQRNGATTRVELPSTSRPTAGPSEGLSPSRGPRRATRVIEFH